MCSRFKAIISLFLCGTLLLALFSGCSVFPLTVPSEGEKQDPAQPQGGQTVTEFHKGSASFNGISVTSDGASGGMISTDAVFTVTSDRDMPAEELTSLIHVTPQTEMTCSKTGDRTFSLKPASGLESGTLYRFTVGEKEAPEGSFVFQTERELIVTGQIPTDKTIEIPTNTGIEISFSEAIAKGNLDSSITLEPKTNGRTELYPNGKTIVFIPEKPLKENTVYTVTVKKGLASVTGKQLSEDFSFAFRTGMTATYEENVSVGIDFTSKDLIFKTDETVSVPFSLSTYGEETIQEDDSQISIYRFASAEELLSQYRDYEENKSEYLTEGKGFSLSVDGLKKVSSFSAKPIYEENYSNWYKEGRFELPKLDKGLYAVCIKMSGKIGKTSYEKEDTLLVQVSDLLLYTEETADDLLLWVNHSGSSLCGGDKVTIESFERFSYWSNQDKKGHFQSEVTSLTTDEQGLATVSIKEDHSAFLTVSSYSDVLVRCLNGAGKPNENPYRAWLFTDREVYFSDDKVSFGGYVRKTEDGKAPEKLWFTVGYNKLYQPLPIQPDGSFHGEFLIENDTSWGKNLTIYDQNKEPVLSRYLRITQEDKPVYKATLSFDKKFYRYQDTATAIITATFFDGTPASGLQFSLYGSNGFDIWETAVTDQNGQAFVSVKLGDYYSQSTYPATIYVNAELIGEETTSLYLSADSLYFYSDYWFESNRIVPEDGSQSYSLVTLNRIDTSNLWKEPELSWWNLKEKIIGAPAKGTADVVLKKIEFQKVVTGTYYDTYTKTTRENYYWNDKTTLLSSKSQAFEDGVIRLEHFEMPEDFNGYYIYEIGWTDPTNGNRCTLSEYAVAGTSGTIPNFYVYDTGYELGGIQDGYSVGDSVEIFLRNDEGLISQGKTLFTVYNGTRSFTSVSDRNRMSSVFGADSVLGAQVYATHFDGSQLQTLYPVSLRYDYEKNNNAKLEIKTDKNIYLPGENAETSLRLVTADGAPVPHGFVLLSVVDEACFALADQVITPLESYFSGRYFYVSRNAFYSYLSGFRYWELTYGMAEDGCEEEAPAAMEMAPGEKSANGQKGGESGYIRKDFLDNPLFTVCYLDENGMGNLTFRVPDNITEWRLTAAGIGNSQDGKMTSVKIGTSVSNILCTMPFFINASACDTYITGDDVSCSGRAYGTAIESGTKIFWTAELTDSEGKTVSVLSAETTGSAAANFDFGKPGNDYYTVTIQAESGSYSDAVRLSINIVDSGVMMTAYKDLSPEEIGSIRPAAYPVTLSFYNKAYDGLIKAADKINTGYATRSDCLAASYAVAKKLEGLFGRNGCDADRLTSVQNAFGELNFYGFIPLLRYGSGDVKLTARICLAAPGILSVSAKENLISYTEDYIRNTGYSSPEELCAALLILASLEQIDLTDLAFAESLGSSLTPEADLYLSAAYAAAGDWTSAKNILDSLLNAFGKEEDGELSLVMTNTETSIEMTALALMTASYVDSEKAAAMAAFLDTHISAVELYALERAVYLNRYPLPSRKETTFSYSIGNETFTETFQGRGCYSVCLSKSEFSAFRFLSGNEELSVRAIYPASPEEALKNGKLSDQIILKKTITPYDEEKGLWKVTVSFRITTDRNYESFTLTDCIPSGARYFRTLGNQSFSDGDWYVSAYLRNDGTQKMTGNIWISNYTKENLEGLQEKTFSGEVSYLIRGAVKGEFTSESALCRNVRTECFALSERDKLLIS